MGKARRTGTIHPQKIIRNNTPQAGDVIILTKPLGLGVLTTAIKADLVKENDVQKAISIMSSLNKKSSEIALKNDVHAMTDVTGFGLLGHLCEMLNKNVSIEIEYSALPFLDSCFEFAEMGLFPGGSIRNRKHFLKQIDIQNNKLTKEEILLCFDAQTSGGLLLSIPQEKAKETLNILHNEGIEDAIIIGQVKLSQKNQVILT